MSMQAVERDSTISAMADAPATRTVVTFVIPVRHPDNARNWPALIARLAETARSIAAQTDDGWRGISAANTGAELPPLPAGFEIVRVPFPPNPLYDLTEANRQAAYDAVRFDKGR